MGADADETLGIVLAGGAGSRVGGADKGLLPLQRRTLIACVLDALRPQCDALLVVANRNMDEYSRHAKTIRDEGEGQQLVMERIGPGKWRVSGAVTVRDFRRECPDIGDVPEVETMGGLVSMLLDVVPHASESVNFRGLKLMASRVDERAVRK